MLLPFLAVADGAPRRDTSLETSDLSGHAARACKGQSGPRERRTESMARRRCSGLRRHGGRRERRRGSTAWQPRCQPRRGAPRGDRAPPPTQDDLAAPTRGPRAAARRGRLDRDERRWRSRRMPVIPIAGGERRRAPTTDCRFATISLRERVVDRANFDDVLKTFHDDVVRFDDVVTFFENVVVRFDDVVTFFHDAVVPFDELVNHLQDVVVRFDDVV